MKMSIEYFEKYFRIKPFKGKYNCYGTWQGNYLYETDQTPDDARIAMFKKLKKANWI
jgi:hypothetical protein